MHRSPKPLYLEVVPNMSAPEMLINVYILYMFALYLPKLITLYIPNKNFAIVLYLCLLFIYCKTSIACLSTLLCVLGEFFHIQIVGLRVDNVVCCTNCKAL